jgi:predicted kinase
MPLNNLMMIITGPPASGKSILAKHLSDKYHLPVLQLDTLQEALFESLPTTDNNIIAKASYKILFCQADELAKHSIPFVIESNFNAKDHTVYFKRLEDNYRVEIIQIICDARRSILVKRFAERWKSGQRHPKHNDDKHFADLQTATLVERRPMKLTGSLIKFNTSNTAKINYQKIEAVVDSYI